MANGDPKPLNVLSVDGGGVRGLIPARLVTELERLSGRNAIDLFDGFAGASTGAIIALGLTRDTESGGPLTGRELVELYQRLGPAVFKRKYTRVPRAPVKLKPYDRGPLKRLLRKYLGGGQLGDATKPVLIPAYDLERRRPFWFRSWETAADAQADLSTTDVALAATAAPTVFSPYRIHQTHERAARFTFVDGGIFANNPAQAAAFEFARLHPGRQIRMVSLGTGDVRLVSSKEEDEWNLADWLPALLPVIFDANAEHVDNLMEGEGYHRIQVPLPAVSKRLDDASEVARDKLARAADDYCATQQDSLQALAGWLTEDR